MELDSKFEKLIKGQVQYKSSNLGCNLLISRLQRKFSDYGSQEILKGCVQEMDAFFTKYKNVTKNDVEEISKL